ncbi:MAG: SLATT domain-containing protein [Actinomycetota bacterium]|nr:SLATT domain-containing protein [Actinomycetota bacterium]
MTDRNAEFAALYTEDRLLDQLDFYRGRRAEAEEARDQAIGAKAVLLGLAAVAGVVGAAYPGIRPAMAMAAAFLAAFATALTAYQSLYGFPRLAKLYQDAEISLTALRAFGLGTELDASELRARVELIETVFTQENGQWGQLAKDDSHPAQQ